MEEKIKEKLIEAFDPVELEVVNESHKHIGHAGDDGSGESHFKLMVVSSVFVGMSRVEMHRSVNQVLSNELKHIHALQMILKSP